jgi:uracil-DNA glycosylase
MTHYSAEKLLESMPNGWRRRIGTEFSQPYMKELLSFLNAEANLGKDVFPAADNILRAFQFTDFEDVRAVVLGQDPYHGVGQANGLAFAVHEGMKIPPSLRNIFKEVSSGLQNATALTSDLEGWAQQGVLLLNTVLTVRAHEAFSHRKQGWEQFTDSVIAALRDHPEPIVFLLWGAPAQQKASLLQGSHHVILQAPHPSPLSAHRGFLGCGHFDKANAFLSSRNRGRIDWSRTHV